MGILELLLGGGATGLLGTLLGRVLGFFEKKRDYAHEVTLQKLQLEARAHETERELAIATQEAITRLREASYAHDTNIGQGSPWVVDFLRLVRPALTFLSLFGVALIWCYDGLTPEQEGDIIGAIIYIAITCITWWFGDRQFKK